jgi:hypothetical protein
VSGPRDPADGLSLEAARALLATIDDALTGWQTRRYDPATGRTYVRDGHEAARVLDMLTVELQRVRAALLVELRADEAERSSRVDEMIAAWTAGRPVPPPPPGSAR